MYKITKGDTTYTAEYVWRSTAADRTKDSEGKTLPYPKEGEPFGDKHKIIRILDLAESVLKDVGNYEPHKPVPCKICNKKGVERGIYTFGDRMWSDGATHYINIHNIEPSVSFKEYIYNVLLKNIEKMLGRSKISHKANKTNVYRPGKILQDPKLKEIVLQRVKVNNEDYVKIVKNKLLILDALMVSGGKFKKYIDPYDTNLKRYSEHAGFLDFDNGKLQKIVVSAQTERVDEGDSEIFLPIDMNEMMEYEYIFHTHPPTPKPGGRAEYGILYEYPSMGDIFHFIDHYNEGNVIGSLVIAAEGLYNIRKVAESDMDEIRKIGRKSAKSTKSTNSAKSTNSTNSAKITKHTKSTQNSKLYDIAVDEGRLYDDYRKIFRRLQRDAIEKYGVDFDRETFYSTIAQDLSFINRFNKILNKYQINIDFYPRKKDGNYWYIDTLFLKFDPNL